MGRLPFEVGRLSTMPEREMHDLATELERMDFWRQEEHILGLVETYITHYWRSPHAAATYRPAYVANTSVLGDVYDPTISTESTYTYRDIHIRVPNGIDERSARLFAEMQIREQMDPGFDPTEDET